MLDERLPNWTSDVRGCACFFDDSNHHTYICVHMFWVPSVRCCSNNNTCFNLKQQRDRSIDMEVMQRPNMLGEHGTNRRVTSSYSSTTQTNAQLSSQIDRIATTYHDDDSGVETGVVQCKRPNKCRPRSMNASSGN